MDERDRYHEGLKARRAVLGDAHVDRALAGRTPFTEAFQELITRHAWGELWTRPGLPRATRSLITVALLVALHHDEELRLHVRGALRNGATVAELEEVLLHAAVYCGAPAANRAFRVVGEVLAEEGLEVTDEQRRRRAPPPVAEGHPDRGQEARASSRRREEDDR